MSAQWVPPTDDERLMLLRHAAHWRWYEQDHGPACEWAAHDGTLVTVDDVVRAFESLAMDGLP